MYIIYVGRHALPARIDFSLFVGIAIVEVTAVIGHPGIAQHSLRVVSAVPTLDSLRRYIRVRHRLFRAFLNHLRVYIAALMDILDHFCGILCDVIEI